MKKLGVVLLLLGIVLTVIGGFWIYKTEMEKEPKFNLSDLVDNSIAFYHEDDSSFSIMNFTKDDNTFVVQIRKKKIMSQSGKYDGNNYSLQYPIIIMKDKLVNKNEKFSISYNEGVFTFDSEDNLINSFFGGEYSLEVKDYVIPNSMFDTDEGIFKSEDNNILYLYHSDDSYILEGMIKKDDINIKMNEVLDINSINDGESFEKDNMIIALSSSKITIEKIDYQRVNVLTKNDLRQELKNYLLYPKMYGVII